VVEIVTQNWLKAISQIRVKVDFGIWTTLSFWPLMTHTDPRSGLFYTVVRANFYKHSYLEGHIAILVHYPFEVGPEAK